MRSKNMGYIFRTFGFLVFSATLFAANDALAGQSLGGVINNIIVSSRNVPSLFAGFSYLFGLILGVMGILKLKEHVEAPNQVSIWEPSKRFIAGGAFLVLPYMVNVVYNTITNGNNAVLQARGYNTGGVSGEGLDAKLVNLMSDIWGPMQFLMTGFCYIAGIILLMIGISRLLKSEQEGPRGPMGLGTIMTFMVAGILLSVNQTVGAAVNSIFDGGALTYAGLAYTAGMDGDAVGHSNAVIGAIMAFVAIVGWISFIRGFFIIRGVSEGSGQASMMAAVTHIIGGAVAINLGGIIAAVQETLGINELGLEISSLEPYITSVTFIV